MISLDFHKLHELNQPKEPFVQVREGFVWFSGYENILFLQCGCKGCGRRSHPLVFGTVCCWHIKPPAGYLYINCNPVLISFSIRKLFCLNISPLLPLLSDMFFHTSLCNNLLFPTALSSFLQIDQLFFFFFFLKKEAYMLCRFYQAPTDLDFNQPSVLCNL